jgi:predicted lactoylglutathione lyase
MSAFTTLMTPQGMQGLGALVFPKADPFEMNGFSRVSTGARRVVMAPSEQQLMALIMKERQDRFAQEGFSRVKNPSRIMTATGPQDFKTADELFRKSEEMSVKVGVANNIQGSAQRYRRSREVLIDAINSYKKEVGDETLTDIQVIKALNERNPREAFSDNEVVWTKPLRSSEVRAVGVQDKDSPLAYKTAEEYVASKTPMYHGTRTKFDKFDKKFTGGTGFYFTPDEGQASLWAGRNFQTGKIPETSEVKKVFLDIKNPAPSDIVKKAYEDAKGGNPLKQVHDKLQSLGYDGYTKNNGETIVFNPEQIKTESQLISEWQAARGKK